MFLAALGSFRFLVGVIAFIIIGVCISPTNRLPFPQLATTSLGSTRKSHGTASFGTLLCRAQATTFHHGGGIKYDCCLLLVAGSAFIGTTILLVFVAT
jgi:hypothetical protein